jgi:hypothetical protein
MSSPILAPQLLDPKRKEELFHWADTRLMENNFQYSMASRLVRELVPHVRAVEQHARLLEQQLAKAAELLLSRDPEFRTRDTESAVQIAKLLGFEETNVTMREIKRFLREASGRPAGERAKGEAA